MNNPPIPDWTAEGILPPLRSIDDPLSKERSPYECELTSLVERFATSKERCNILEGLIEYRKFLRELGIIEGFQWINGSFTEDKERLEKAPPKDIDVVTFFKQPLGLTQASLSEEQLAILFKPKAARAKFKVDASIQPLGQKLDESQVREIIYWHGIWSHSRQQKWKGFLKVSLKASDDETELSLLNSIKESL